MSTSYSFRIAAGFEFTPEDLADAFGEEIKGKSHTEVRFDPKTGAKLKPVKVMDSESRVVCKFDGKVYESDEWEQLADHVARNAKCRAISSVYDFSGDGSVVFGPKMPNEAWDGLDLGHIELEGPLPLEPILKLGPELKRIAAALKKLGLKPGKPILRICYCIG
jgi:hypothetical protein